MKNNYIQKIKAILLVIYFYIFYEEISDETYWEINDEDYEEINDGETRFSSLLLAMLIVTVLIILMMQFKILLFVGLLNYHIFIDNNLIFVFFSSQLLIALLFS